MGVKLVASNDTIVAHARVALNEIEKKMPDASAIVIVAISEDGTYAIRGLSDQGKIREFDMYARAGAVIDHQKQSFLG
jgi:hypothetical protein